MQIWRLTDSLHHSAALGAVCTVARSRPGLWGTERGLHNPHLEDGWEALCSIPDAKVFTNEADSAHSVQGLGDYDRQFHGLQELESQ